MLNSRWKKIDGVSDNFTNNVHLFLLDKLNHLQTAFWVSVRSGSFRQFVSRLKQKIVGRGNKKQKQFCFFISFFLMKNELPECIPFGIDSDSVFLQYFLFVCFWWWSNHHMSLIPVLKTSVQCYSIPCMKFSAQSTVWITETVTITEQGFHIQIALLTFWALLWLESNRRR